MAMLCHSSGWCTLRNQRGVYQVSTVRCIGVVTTSWQGLHAVRCRQELRSPIRTKAEYFLATLRYKETQ